MSETKFTPGTWWVTEGELDGDPFFEILAANNSISGEKTVAQTIIGDNRYPEYIATERANARLIAAAPELYHALLAAEESIVSFMGTCKLDANSGAGAILQEIRSALAKARGDV